MEHLFVAEKAMIEYIIDNLKTLDIKGFENYKKLVNCVSLLEGAMKNELKQGNPPDQEHKAEVEEVNG